MFNLPTHKNGGRLTARMYWITIRMTMKDWNTGQMRCFVARDVPNSIQSQTAYKTATMSIRVLIKIANINSVTSTPNLQKAKFKKYFTKCEISLSASLRVTRGNNTFGRAIDLPLKNLSSKRKVFIIIITKEGCEDIRSYRTEHSPFSLLMHQNQVECTQCNNVNNVTAQKLCQSLPFDHFIESKPICCVVIRVISR